MQLLSIFKAVALCRHGVETQRDGHLESRDRNSRKTRHDGLRGYSRMPTTWLPKPSGGSMRHECNMERLKRLLHLSLWLTKGLRDREALH